MALAPGGLPQGPENGLWHRGPAAANGGSHVESLRHLDPDGYALALAEADRAASSRHPCHRSGLARSDRRRHQTGSPPWDHTHCSGFVAHHCQLWRLPQPQRRWTSRMADLMEGLVVSSDHLTRRSSRGSLSSSLNCVKLSAEPAGEEKTTGHLPLSCQRGRWPMLQEGNRR